ncbi:unnamed protein product [Prorocentrum cordatum]|uniref:Uncharacterized protein n=1 Tax=Prorocentrum cordatum TaxID=2364126 RepID=A0ABN9S5Z5_9DINO|nr:unnamed protein product [Polarella glacialis]
MADLSAVFSEADTVILSCRLWPASRQFDSHRFGSGSTTASCNDKSMPLSDLSEVAGGVLAEQCGEPLAGFSSAQGTAAHEAGVDVVQSRRRRIAQRRALGRERLMRPDCRDLPGRSSPAQCEGAARRRGRVVRAPLRLLQQRLPAVRGLARGGPPARGRGALWLRRFSAARCAGAPSTRPTRGSRPGPSDAAATGRMFAPASRGHGPLFRCAMAYPRDRALGSRPRGRG